MAQNISERKISMRKYAIPGIMLLVGHEITSIFALIVTVSMFLADIASEADKKGGF